MLELKAYIPMKVLPVSLSQGLLDLGIANCIEETAFSNILSIMDSCTLFRYRTLLYNEFWLTESLYSSTLKRLYFSTMIIKAMKLMGSLTVSYSKLWIKFLYIPFSVTIRVLTFHLKFNKVIAYGSFAFRSIVPHYLPMNMQGRVTFKLRAFCLLAIFFA